MNKESYKKLLYVKTPADVQEILFPYSPQKFFDIVYNTENSYQTIEIKKRNGSPREISIPNNNLKQIQKKLLPHLYFMYKKFYIEKRPSAHGFLKKKSIFTNAKMHIRKQWVLNFDLKNFFPSINFGRVRGLLMSSPYKLEKNCATILAKIICYNNELPQGGVTSPIVSNMICAKLDGELQRLAKTHRCRYTRYADDITFSTNTKKFLLAKKCRKKIILDKEIKYIVKKNGFSINKKKNILRPYFLSQKVTGLKVNKFVNVDRKYIRDIRVLLHIWSKYGLQEASKRYFNKSYSNSHKYINNDDERKKIFNKIVKGKIQHVINARQLNKSPKDKENFNGLHRRLYEKYLINCMISSSEESMIIGEGIIDYFHMKKAFQVLQTNGKFPDLKLDFFKRNKVIKNYESFDGCNSIIGLFDRIKKYQSIYSACFFVVDNEEKIQKKDEPHCTEKKNIFFIKLPKECCEKKEYFAIEDLYSKELHEKHGYSFDDNDKMKNNKKRNDKKRNDKKRKFARKIYEKENSPESFKNFIPLFEEIEKSLKKISKKQVNSKT